MKLACLQAWFAFIHLQVKPKNIYFKFYDQNSKLPHIDHSYYYLSVVVWLLIGLTQFSSKVQILAHKSGLQ